MAEGIRDVGILTQHCFCLCFIVLATAAQSIPEFILALHTFCFCILVLARVDEREIENDNVSSLSLGEAVRPIPIFHHLLVAVCIVSVSSIFI